MKKLTLGLLMLALAVIGIVGTGWLSCFISDKYWTACFIQGAAFFFVGFAGAFVISESQL